jgi:3,4-dehydroadipyl-CoA semialdehyde dehydrogenase
VLSLVCGGARELTDLVTGQDAIAFTGSADTAAALKTHKRVIESCVRLNIEADSLNACILGPDAKPGSPEFDFFVREVVREMTTKAGQKCTAIRRAFVPKAVIGDVAQAIEAALAKVVVGNPRNETVTMGPVVTKSQQKAVQDALAKLKTEAKVVTGDGALKPVDADPEKSCFIAPTLLRCDAPTTAKVVHDVEPFGPVSTLMPYDNAVEAIQLADRGEGSLVASIFTGDKDFARDTVLGIGPYHGRVLVVDSTVGKAQTGHGIVMPMCVHGGPGRAGNGAELGGLRGLQFYHQRLAVQGRADWLQDLVASGADANG